LGDVGRRPDSQRQDSDPGQDPEAYPFHFSRSMTGVRCPSVPAGYRTQVPFPYSTVTLFARFRGWSTSHPRRQATW
jgi:hypothetical protein